MRVCVHTVQPISTTTHFAVTESKIENTVGLTIRNKGPLPAVVFGRGEVGGIEAARLPHRISAVIV